MEDHQTTEAMDSKWEELLPKADYFGKALDLVASFDRLLVSLYTALIAGIIVLLIHEEVSLWVGAPLVIALILFILGIGHTLLHMAFTSKVLLQVEALANGTKVVPNVVEEDEPTLKALARNKAYAQRCYSSQLIYLFLGVTSSAFAVVFRLWQYAWRAGVIGLICLVLLVVIVTLVMMWKNTLHNFPSSPCHRKTQNGLSKETH